MFEYRIKEFCEVTMPRKLSQEELNKHLRQIRNNEITELNLRNLRNKGIGDEEVRWLGEALKVNSSLTYLNLVENNIGEGGARSLSEALEKNQSLTSLNLWWNNIRDGGARSLSEALEKNQSLTFLDLRFNIIRDGGARLLAEALKENSSLTFLNLMNNNIGDEGANSLAEALKVNNSLASLNLTGDKIGEGGARSLSEALNENSSLTSLDLRGNNIGDGGVRSLSEALEKNRSLTFLDLEDNNIGEGGARSLSEALEKNKCLSYYDGNKTDELKNRVDKNKNDNENLVKVINSEFKNYLEALLNKQSLNLTNELNLKELKHRAAAIDFMLQVYSGNIIKPNPEVVLFFNKVNKKLKEGCEYNSATQLFESSIKDLAQEVSNGYYTQAKDYPGMYIEKKLRRNESYKISQEFKIKMEKIHAIDLMEQDRNKEALEVLDKIYEKDSTDSWTLEQKKALEKKLRAMQQKPQSNVYSAYNKKEVPTFNTFSVSANSDNKSVTGVEPEAYSASTVGNLVNASENRVDRYANSRGVNNPKVSNDLYNKACKMNAEELKNIIIKENESVNSVDKYGRTFIHKLITSSREFHEKAKELLNKKELDFDLNLTDSLGKTYLHHAAEQGNFDLVEQLLSIDADPKIEDNYGNTMLYYLIRNKMLDEFDKLLNSEYSQEFPMKIPSNYEAREIAKALRENVSDVEDPELNEISPYVDDGSACGSSLVTYQNMSYPRFIELYNKGKYRKVLQKLDWLGRIEVDPELLLIKARCYQALGKFEESEILLDYISYKYPEDQQNYVEILLIRAQNNMRLGKYEVTSQCFSELKAKAGRGELTKDQGVEARFAHMKYLYYSGYKSNAKQKIDNAMPERLDIELLNIRGNIAKAEGNLDNALEYYNMALSRSGWETHPLSLFNKGIILLKQGNIDDAYRYFNDALLPINLDYEDNILRQINVGELRKSIEQELNALSGNMGKDPEKLAEESMIKMQEENGGSARDPNNNRSNSSGELNQQEHVLQYLIYIDSRLGQVENQQKGNIGREEAYRQFVSREEVSYAIARNEEWKKVEKELNLIYNEDELRGYYYTFINVFNSHFKAATTLASNAIENNSTGFSRIKDIIPIPAVKELVGVVGGALDKAIEYKHKRKIGALLELANNSNIEREVQELARKITISKAEEIRNCQEDRNQLQNLFSTIMQKIKVGSLEASCKTDYQKLAYKDASTAIVYCYSGEINAEYDIIEQLTGYVINGKAFSGDHAGKADNAAAAGNIANKAASGAEKAAAQANNCTVMNVSKIDYDDPEIDAAMKEGDVDALKAALENGKEGNSLKASLGREEQEDNLQKSYLEENANLEKLLAANNIDRGSFEEIIEGLCQIDVPDFEEGHSSSQTEHQAPNNYTNEQLEVSKLGDEEAFDENHS